MAEAHDSRKILYQNLEDTGMDPRDAEQCAEFLESGQTDAAIRALNEHRRALLRDIHKQQKQIDCLDYLTHRIEKQGGKYHG